MNTSWCKHKTVFVLLTYSASQHQLHVVEVNEYIGEHNIKHHPEKENFKITLEYLPHVFMSICSKAVIGYIASTVSHLIPFGFMILLKQNTPALKKGWSQK